MKLTSHEKKVIAAVIAAGAVAALLAFLGGRLLADRGQPSASTETTAVSTRTVSQTAAAVTVTVSGQNGAVPVEIVDQSVTPDNPGYGQEITFTARVKGDPDTVYMYFGPAGGDVGGSHRLPMLKGSASGGVTDWTVRTTAIHGFGENHKVYYNSSAITKDGIEVKFYTGSSAPPEFTVNG